jgi:aminopeptidase N
LEINNFYTVTIYEKGAEVVRMMQTLVGRAGCAKGMKLYFERHDGQAVTCDDFAQAIADANPQSALAQHLNQFKRWYSQAGTPQVHVTSSYDAQAQRYSLHFTQSCASTPGQLIKQPFVIPIQLGLLKTSGEELGAPQLLVLQEEQQTLVFDNITEQPVPSLLRGFSAPVHLVYDYTVAELLTMLAHDTDAFNRWEAAQRLGLKAAMVALNSPTLQDQPLPLDLVEGLRHVLRHPDLDAAFKELVLTLPSESYIAEQCEQVDPQKIHAVREAMRLQLATALHDDWAWAFQHHAPKGTYQTDAASCGQRALRGMALVYLCLAGQRQSDNTWAQHALAVFEKASNMTERMHGLSALVHIDHPLASKALTQFHALFKHEELVLDKWFALQASASSSADVLAKVRQLMQHPDFHLHNPNRARSLISSYCSNAAAFHRTDAAGYVFWSERVLEIDSFNPQVAARLARTLDRWRKLVEPYRSAAHEAIRRVAAKDDLSADVREVINAALED